MQVFSARDVSGLVIRDARRADVPAIVFLNNAGGPDGRPRTVLPEILPKGYDEAYDTIAASPNDRLMVVEWQGRVVGTFHITFLTYLAAMGQPDMQIESVHVHPELRGKGIGAHMMHWAIAVAKEKNCRRVQLTSNKSRHDAHRFYERLGFKASHEGMKLVLASS